MKIKKQTLPIFLEAKVTHASDSEDLIKLAKKKGIVLPSNHLGVFKTIYAQADGRPNRNGVRLDKEAVEEALPSLIGAQVNINHWRQNWTVGSIFWAKLNDKDEIEVAFTFFKDIYSKEFKIANELLEKGELTVSFELTYDPDTQESHSDGTVTLHDMTFVGMGFLLDEKPAEPTAIVFEMAKIKRRVMDLIKNDSPDLVFAREAVVNCQDLLETINAAIEEKKLNPNLDLSDKTANIHIENNEEKIDKDLEKGGIAIMKEKEKKDVKTEDQKVVDEKVETTKADVKVEDVKSEEVKEDKKVDEKTDKSEDTSKDEKEASEEKPEDADLKIVTEEKKVITETMDEKSDTVEVESEIKQTVTRDDEVVSEVTSNTSEKTVWTFAEVEKIKADYEAKIATLETTLSSKDKEIVKAKEDAVKVDRLKSELGEYVVDFSDEDFSDETKVENARLKKENADLKKSKEVIKKASEDKDAEDKDEEIETASLDTGHVENTESKGSPLVQLLKEKNKK